MKELMLQVCLAIKTLSKIRKQRDRQTLIENTLKNSNKILTINMKNFTPHDKALDNILFEGIKSC